MKKKTTGVKRKKKIIVTKAAGARPERKGMNVRNDVIQAICESNTTGEEEVSVEDDMCGSSSCHSRCNLKEVPQMGSTTEHPQESSVHASVLTTEEKQEYGN